MSILFFLFFFFSSRRRHTRCSRDWSSDVCSSDLFGLKGVAVSIQAETGRDAQRRFARQIPDQDRRQVMRSVLQTEAITVAESSIHFETGREILAAKGAGPRRRLQGQRPADAPRIAELPRRVPDV